MAGTVRPITAQLGAAPGAPVMSNRMNHHGYYRRQPADRVPQEALAVAGGTPQRQQMMPRLPPGPWAMGLAPIQRSSTGSLCNW